MLATSKVESMKASWCCRDFLKALDRLKEAKAIVSKYINC
jgi:hypothetical protein